MKSLIALFSLFLSLTVNASTFSCQGLADMDEYTVDIELSQGTASFFDNDTISDMTKTESYLTETYPSELVYEFTGKDMGYMGDLKLVFNYTNKMAYLYSFNTIESISLSLIGSAPCKEIVK